MRILITVAIFLSLSVSGWSQIKFFRMYTDQGVDMGQGIVQLEDSSYVITGSSSSFADAPSQAFLLKIDSLGNYIWSQTYGGSEVESGRRVLYKKNFGFYICGYTNSMGSGGFDFYLAKVDENANLEWETTVGDYGWEKVNDAALTSDTGTIMVGETSSNVTDNKDIYIVRTDINGDTLWTKTIGGPGDDFATCIRQYNDSLYAVGGQVWLEDSLLSKAWLAFIEDDGTVYWSDTAGFYGNYWINDLDFDGTRIIAVGGSNDGNNDGTDFYFQPYDVNGTFEWPFEWPEAGEQNHVGITEYGPTNDLYVITSYIDGFSFEDGPDIKVQKFLTNFLWQNALQIGHDGPDVFGQVIPTSDGSAALVGYTTGFISGGNEVFVAKIGPGNDNYPDPWNDLQVDGIVIVDQLAELGLLNIYPNPAENVIHINTDKAGYTAINMVDGTGKTVISQELNFEASLDVRSFPSGWYVLEISGTNMQPVRKKVIIR